MPSTHLKRLGRPLKERFKHGVTECKPGRLSRVERNETQSFVTALGLNGRGRQVCENANAEKGGADAAGYHHCKDLRWRRRVKQQKVVHVKNLKARGRASRVAVTHLRLELS